MSTLNTHQAAFERALHEFNDKLSVEDRKTFSKYTAESDVRRAIQDMETSCGEKRKLRNLKRMEPFLDFLMQYHKVFEVFGGVGTVPLMDNATHLQAHDCLY